MPSSSTPKLAAIRAIVSPWNSSFLYNQFSDQPVRELQHVELEIELHDAAAAAEPARGALPRGSTSLALRVLQHDQDLEQRAVAQAALRPQLLHQHLERHVLVGIRIQDRLPARLQQVRETGGCRTDRCAAPAC